MKPQLYKVFCTQVHKYENYISQIEIKERSDTTLKNKMVNRLGFNINAKELRKLKEIDSIRPDLRGYDTTTKAHIALQEWFKVNFEEALKKGMKLPKVKMPELLSLVRAAPQIS